MPACYRCSHQGQEAGGEPEGSVPGLSGDMQEPATWLRQQRATARLTQEELAERSGLSVRAIGKLESGETRRPHPNTLRLLARTLGLPEPVAAELIARGRAGQGSRSCRWPLAALDAGSRPAPSGGDEGGPAGSVVNVPHQLPAAVAAFAGRAAELAILDEWLDQSRRNGVGGTAAMSAISGMPGVGKTALALQWAHRVAGQFPHGQLYINLRGFDSTGQPADVGQAVCGLLQALGVAAQQIPAALDFQAALYRSLLAGRRMLIIADNARHPAQVRPLLPSAPGCTLVVTSRSNMSGLAAAEGAQVLRLDLPTEADAAQLLSCRLGHDRIVAEPEATAELIRLCARLPLALAAVAALAGQSDWPLAELAGQLAGAGEPLALLSLDDPAADVRSVFSWSHQQLSAESARMFRLLAAHPGPDISAMAAANLAGVTARRAQALLRELADVAMIAERAPGCYAMHDLLRAYAAEQGQESAADCLLILGTLLETLPTAVPLPPGNGLPRSATVRTPPQ